MNLLYALLFLYLFHRTLWKLSIQLERVVERLER
jgi:hypothetical protein